MTEIKKNEIENDKNRATHVTYPSYPIDNQDKQDPSKEVEDRLDELQDTAAGFLFIISELLRTPEFDKEDLASIIDAVEETQKLLTIVHHEKQFPSKKLHAIPSELKVVAAGLLTAISKMLRTPGFVKEAQMLLIDAVEEAQMLLIVINRIVWPSPNTNPDGGGETLIAPIPLDKDRYA